ncbi:unnamed protein product [Mycena citricolor]|uniref:Arrestin-like N-terminal domain-containing protein n=1 Tax=Mycena citricolor TaxID=2018698 RepID=A0AAD2GTC4_9AGAR|nr:unnamed protein product [Mycena citricolor]CAK5276674.1 unnamed protein product [Mycena citricolor]
MTSLQSPPTYLQTSPDELPAYGQLQEPSQATSGNPLADPNPKEYTFDIRNYWSKPSATLTILAHSKLSVSAPVFVAGSAISGSFKLFARSPDPVKAITLQIRGDLCTSGEPVQRSNFLNVKKVLWDPSMGDPSAPGPGAGGPERDKKLKGDYEWKFAIPTQELVVAGAEEGQQPYRMPHTFKERFSRAAIDYYLVLLIERKGKFQSNDRIVAHFNYFTTDRPARPSPRRELAYRNGTTAPGPFEDPDGWRALDPVEFRGTLFGERAIAVKCSVYIAKPFTYTRSTAIPCAMTIETADRQAADVFASIKSSGVHLQRCVRCTYEVSSSEVEALGQVVWSPAPVAADESVSVTGGNHVRHLVGEIALSKDLSPSGKIRYFSLEYAIVITPPNAVAFKPDDSKPRGLFPVEIVTTFAPGPRPRVSSPPAYPVPGSGGTGRFDRLDTVRIF